MTMERWQTVKITRSFQSLKIKLTHVITHSVTFSQRWHDSSVAKSSWRVKVNPSIPSRICLSPYCQPYNSYNVRSENLVLDQLIIPKLIFFFILITCLVNIVLMFKGEILSWSLMGVNGSKENDIK